MSRRRSRSCLDEELTQVCKKHIDQLSIQIQIKRPQKLNQVSVKKGPTKWTVSKPRWQIHSNLDDQPNKISMTILIQDDGGSFMIPWKVQPIMERNLKKIKTVLLTLLLEHYFLHQCPVLPSQKWVFSCKERNQVSVKNPAMCCRNVAFHQFSIKSPINVCRLSLSTLVQK